MHFRTSILKDFSYTVECSSSLENTQWQHKQNQLIMNHLTIINQEEDDDDVKDEQIHDNAHDADEDYDEYINDKS